TPGVSPARAGPQVSLLLGLFGVRTAAAALAEVVDVEGFDELLEHGQLLFVDGYALFLRDAGFSLCFLTFKNHASLIEDGFLDEDRHFGADGEGDGVAGAGVDLEVLAVLVEDEARVEGLVGEVVDDDLGELAAELLDDAAQEVVGERAANGHVLHRYGDR